MVMKIYISEEDLVQNVQQRFREAFPFLEIHFPLIGADKKVGSEVAPETPIDDIRMQHSFGWIDVDGSKTVEQLEREFMELFGLTVEIFRKGKNCCFSTRDTCYLPLREQNAVGGRSQQCTAQPPEVQPVKSATPELPRASH